MENKSLHLFTSSFPMNKAPESVFILPELKFLSENFDVVYLYPNSDDPDVTFDLPRNVKVIKLKEKDLVKLNFWDYLSVSKNLLSEIIANRKILKSQNLKYLFSLLKKFVSKKNQLKKYFQESNNLSQNDLIYTYWMDEWCTILSLLKGELKYENQFVTRTHGFDLYDERNEMGKIPFRKLQLRHLDKVFSISETGSKYLSRNYPKFSYKIDFSRLGVFNHGISNVSNEVLTVVSCSSISEVKRVYLITEVLSKVTVNVLWVHFGDGPMKKLIETNVDKLPSNIKYELKGNVSNDIVLNYYKNQSVNLFINVSKSEGIPMSMMEAISFSIPVMAFDVGGISEIVNKHTGILIEPNNHSKMIEVLNDFPNHSVFSNHKRREARIFWEQNFDAGKNHSFFMQKLKQLK